MAQTLQTKITANDAANGDWFGSSVAIDGDYAIVGSPRDDTSRGAAYVYVWNAMTSEWEQQARLVAFDRAASDLYGTSVAISGNLVAIGAPDEVQTPFSSGSVYVYHRTGTSWFNDGKILATDRQNNDDFGDSVAMDGNVLAIGATKCENGLQTDTGAAYIFRYNGVTWVQETKLFASNSMPGDLFGDCVSLSGADLVVGARLSDGAGSGSGSAYVFHDSGGGVWTEQGILTASDAAGSDNFGWSVSIDGDTAAVGATLDDLTFGGSNEGSAYIFTRSAGVWSQQAKITAAFASMDDGFGSAVAVRDDSLVVGAYTADGQEGLAFTFERNGSVWSELASFGGGTLGDTAQFGSAVAMSSDLELIVGAIGDDHGGGVTDNPGAAHIFEFVPGGDPDCDGDGLTDAQEALLGTNPCVSDTDADGLSDSLEVTLAAGSGCPDPLVADTDIDGLSDGYENTSGPNICDADADDDGLIDGDEVNIHGTLPGNADTDGDGLNDGAEVAMAAGGDCPNPVNDPDSDDDGLLDGADVSAGMNPCDPDTDDDTLGDALEVAFGTDGNDSDTDDDGLFDGQEVTIAAGSGCPNPIVADSDGDSLNDGFENGAGLNPCDADTDADGLADGNEGGFGTNPLDSDSDDDGLLDGHEVTLAAGSGCPSPTNDDSDGDGVSDGNELTAGLGPCDPDSDNDGLSDGNEPGFGTDPLIADTDGDGLLDGTEVDIAMGTGCPNPLNPDSDGDTLNDGSEVSMGTNPCNPDTDDDGFPDNIDPTPTVPGVPAEFLENIARAMADQVQALDLSVFLGPNNNARQGRQNNIATHFNNAANAIANGNYNAAISQLTVVLNRIDGISPQPDWMVDGPERVSLHADVVMLITLLELLN